MILVPVGGFSWAPIVPLGLMCGYTILWKPYVKIKENYRSAFNYLVMCCWSATGIIGQYFSNKSIQYIHLYVSLWGLLPAVIIFSLISILHDAYTQKFLK